MSWDDKSAIVLGSDGFLGRHLARHLRQCGWKVFPVGRSAGNLDEDRVVQSIFEHLPRVSRIFHLVTRQRTGAAQLGIQGELLAINSRIHLNVLEAWRLFQPQAKLISAGSSCAFPESTMPIPEDNFQSGALHPSVRGYGLAKQLLAVGSECYATQYGLQYLHLFLATLYGPGDHYEVDRSHFLSGMLHRAVKEKSEGRATFSVWGSAETVRDLMYVQDQVEAILAADKHFSNCMLNCTSNSPVTIGTCATAICRALAWEPSIVYPEGSFRGADFKTLDSTRFLGRSDWTPKVSLEFGLQQVLEYDYQTQRSPKA